MIQGFRSSVAALEARLCEHFAELKLTELDGKNDIRRTTLETTHKVLGA